MIFISHANPEDNVFTRWLALQLGRCGYENKPESEGVRPAMQEGEPCRKCSTPVIKRMGRRKPSRDYYYEYHLFCPNCQTTYHIEEANRFVEQPRSLF